MLNRQRAPYANGMGVTTLANDLRRAADVQDSEAVVTLGGVDAELLRLVADKLDADECEIESLAAHSARVHRALCEAIDDIDALEDNPPVSFVFVSAADAFAPVDALTPRQFADLAVFLLDEAE